MPEKRFVVVTTDSERRGVFAGYLEEQVWDSDKAIVKLSDAQMAVYWSKETHGVVGLAAQGPNEKCRISPPVPFITLNGVTAVMDTNDKAISAWQKQPWG